MSRICPGDPEGELQMIKARLITWLVLALSMLAALTIIGCRSAHTTSAILYIDDQNYQKAIDVIDEGLQYTPHDPEAYFWQGEAYSRMADKAIQDNDYVKARHSYESAYLKYMTSREMDPENMTDQVDESLKINYQNRMRDAQLMQQGDYYEQAEGFYRLAYAALPDSVAPIQDIANMKMAEAANADSTKAHELMGEALDLLDQVLAVRPEKYELQADKAYVLTYLGQLDQAEAIYDALLKTHSDDPSLLADVVSFALQRQDYARAAGLNMEIADIYQNDVIADNDAQVPKLYADAGIWYRFANRYADAVVAFDHASQADPNDTNLLLDRLKTYYLYGKTLSDQADASTDPVEKQNLVDQAHTAYQRGVEVGNALTSIAVNEPQGFQFLALCQFGLGDSVAAEQNMKTYTELTGGS